MAATDLKHSLFVFPKHINTVYFYEPKCDANPTAKECETPRFTKQLINFGAGRKAEQDKGTESIIRAHVGQLTAAKSDDLMQCHSVVAAPLI